jgi:hypothetical protein
MKTLNNRSGKVITIFIVIFAVILGSLAALMTFFWQKESEMRKSLEVQLAEARQTQEQISVELKKVQKARYLLEEKNKEADDKINSLLDEVELEKGIREEGKKEMSAIKSQLEREAAEKEKLRRQLATELMETEQKIAELQNKLDMEIRRREKAEKIKDDLEQENLALAQDLEAKSANLAEMRDRLANPTMTSPMASRPTNTMSTPPTNSFSTGASDPMLGDMDPSFDPMLTVDDPSMTETLGGEPAMKASGGSIELDPIQVTSGSTPQVNPSSPPVSTPRSNNMNVEIEPIVVSAPEFNPSASQPASGMMALSALPSDLPDGRILSVDRDTNFVIVNLGEKDGLQSGHVLSVYRGEEYLGDIAVTRVQAEMSAADLIQPVSSKIVRKNDQVVSK